MKQGVIAKSDVGVGDDTLLLVGGHLPLDYRAKLRPRVRLQEIT